MDEIDRLRTTFFETKSGLDLPITTKFLNSQKEFSEKTFGPGYRIKAVTNHIRKELQEIEENPDDVEEWADVLLLAFDGAMRSGHQPEEILAAVHAKFEKNRQRQWPDWRTVDPDQPIEHVRAASSGRSVPMNGEKG